MRLKTGMDLNGRAITTHDNRPVAHFSFSCNRILRSLWIHPLGELSMLDNKSLIARSLYAEVTFMTVAFSGIFL